MVFYAAGDNSAAPVRFSKCYSCQSPVICFGATGGEINFLWLRANALRNCLARSRNSLAWFASKAVACRRVAILCQEPGLHRGVSGGTQWRGGSVVGVNHNSSKMLLFAFDFWNRFIWRSVFLRINDA